jgi:pimeloyl-ACP methyl ester carboxylesterase
VVNGVKLHWVEAGAGPLVVLLHGFPEHWYSWRHQIPALAAAGFRVLAPDMRGYNLSGKPRGVRHYRLEALARDVAELVRRAGADRAHIVGHDWGGLVAWRVAMSHPTVVDRLVVLNAPHPGAMLRGLFRNGQLKRSRYILFFQVPRLAERRFAAEDFAILRRYLRRDPVRPGAFSEEDVQRYVEALRQPGALTAALNYYRAAFRSAPLLLFQSHPRIVAPVLLIWGERDRYLGLHLIDGTQGWVDDLRVERIPEASHWVQADAPDRVNGLIVGHLGGGRLVPERAPAVGQSRQP